MNKPDLLIFFIFIFLGTFSFIAALLNIKWFFNTQGAATIIRWFGRNGARIFYAVLGVILIACGITGLLSGR